MDSKKVEALLEKYWVGETSLEEEKLIRQYIREHDLPNRGEDEISYFVLLSDFKQSELNEGFESQILQQLGAYGARIQIKRFLRIAASIILVVSATLFVYQQHTQRQERLSQLAEAREAFELTKQALFLVSTELNRGATFAQELEEFDLTVEKIKKRDSNVELHN